ncbi:MAG TPA: protein translocase subunit SecF, partial [Thermoanaerobaculia bacterium]|nr:protein translocase subunit SecF [Thermoanaerobaculia bacterium]
MEFFKIRRTIPFMRYALVFNIISIVTFVIAVGALGIRGLHLGVDFTGGTVMELKYPQPPNLQQIRDAVAKLGFTDAAVQNFGTASDVLIRLPVKEGLTSAQLSERVMSELRKTTPEVKLQRVEFVGPQVGRELLENGALALLFVSLGIVLYLWLRFEWKFGVS